MTDFKFILASIVIFTGVSLVLWFRVFRKRHESFIDPPRAMPKRAEFRPENYEDYSPVGNSRVIWKACAAKVQPAGSVECVAYSLRSLLLSPPFGLTDSVNVDIKTLFVEISERDDQKGEERGLNPIGAMKYLEEKGLIGKESNFLTKILRRFGFLHAYFNFKTIAQIADYVRGYGCVIAAISVCENPRIDERGLLYAMDGAFAYSHSIFIYGVDENYRCPDNTTGAFRVRWHSDWFGGSDGWLSFALADRLIDRNRTYGTID